MRSADAGQIIDPGSKLYFLSSIILAFAMLFTMTFLAAAAGGGAYEPLVVLFPCQLDLRLPELELVFGLMGLQVAGWVLSWRQNFHTGAAFIALNYAAAPLLLAISFISFSQQADYAGGYALALAGLAVLGAVDYHRNWRRIIVGD